MSEIARQPRPEKIFVPTGQQNAFLAVEAIRTALLMMTMVVVVTELRTALNKEQTGIVVVCAIGRRSAVGHDHTIALTKIIKIERLIK